MTGIFALKGALFEKRQSGCYKIQNFELQVRPPEIGEFGGKRDDTCAGLDTFPAFMGEEFTGTLTARLTPLPRHPLSVALACEDVEWVTTGYGDKRKTRRVVRKLGSVSTTADARTFSPSNVGQRGRLSIDVPGGLPASSRDDRGNGVRWWLRVATTADDDPFSCEFEIPVFERPKT